MEDQNTHASAKSGVNPYPELKIARMKRRLNGIINSESTVFLRDKYLFLLFSLICLLLIPPFFKDLNLEKGVLEFLLTLVLLSSLNFLRKMKKIIRYGLAFGMIAFIFNWINLFIGHFYLKISTNLFFMIFFLIVFYFLVKDIFNAPRINKRMISGAIAAYIVLGIMAAFLFATLDQVYPGSFNEPMSTNDAIFFSFTTITTLGYGNIIPVKIQAQTLSYFSAIAGQIYITVLVAIIVGKYLIHSQGKSG